MGLGLHGGGVASARYCAEAGADVTVTDLRDEDALDESIRQLSDLRISFVLGRHEISDFRRADIVVKNPAVPRSVPFLDEARRIETDVSLFLAAFGGPVLAVTGTKGKSSVASALHHVLAASDGRARIGGNITVSPLSFVHELEGDEPVVLELSSFQLGDLLLTPAADSGRGPAFAVSAITNIMPDHQDYYASMGEYAADKAIIFSSQAADNWCVLSQDDEWSRAFRPPHPDRTIRLTSTSPLPPTGGVAGFDGDRGVLRLSEGGHPVVLVEPDTKLPGRHMRTNLLFGGVMAHLYGAPAELVRERTASFGGVPHRLETVEIVRGVRFVNDSAATIAEATSAALDSFSGPVRLIAGGSDKGVPLDAFVRVAASASSLHLLEGTATERIIGLLTKAGLPYEGPYGSLEDAVDAAASAATPGDVVLLSPGCASFGMFRNEFDRGDRFRRLVEERARMVR
jgi:UDP-N-acetylmuramoylalanine--D-glutamate ligase